MPAPCNNEEAMTYQNGERFEELARVPEKLREVTERAQDSKIHLSAPSKVQINLMIRAYRMQTGVALDVFSRWSRF